MDIQFTLSALGDLDSGRIFYDGIDIGLGSYFIDSILSDIESLHLYAGIHSLHCGSHRMLAKRFPYAIYYRIRIDKIIVIAVLDTRMKPNSISGRLETE